jgi:hypothetical protein
MLRNRFAAARTAFFSIKAVAIFILRQPCLGKVPLAPTIPLRRDRGHRQRGRIGHHRRERAGDPRIGRRPQRVTGGTKVLSDWIKVKITSNPGETFLDRMIALVEGAAGRRRPTKSPSTS